MQRRGAATPKIVVYLVFASLIAAIVAFIAIGYFAYQKDMILPVKPVSISMHDSAGLEPAFYQAKDADEPTKGTITKLERTTKPTMSILEETVWIMGGVVLLLGVGGGIGAGVMRRWRVGLMLIVGGVVVAAGLGAWGWYLYTHRETPYEMTVQPAGKKAAAVTFSTNESTTVKINGKNDSVLSLRTDMKVQAVLTQDNDLALSIVSPIPDKDPKKGEVVSATPSTSAAAGMSQSEELMWGGAGLAALGIAIGLLVRLRMRRKTAGLAVVVICGAVLVVFVWQGAYMMSHRMPPYEVLIKLDGKASGGDAKVEPLKVVVTNRTSVTVDEKSQDAAALKPGMKVSVMLGDDKKTATTVDSPIPEKGPKKGVIVSMAESGTKSGMSFKEEIFWGIAGAAGLVGLIGVMVIFKKHLWAGLSIAVIGGAGCGWCVSYVLGLAQERVAPYDIVLQPDGKGDQKAEAVKVTTDSSTIVKIDGEEKNMQALQPGMKISAALSDNGKTVTTIVSPIPEKKKATLRLPAGFVGSPKHPGEPQYLNATELKDEYLAQSFSVTKGTETFRVDQVDRDPLGFTAFARSLRLGALHDYRPAKILEEGPLLLADIPPVKWLSSENNPFGMDVNAYALVVEGFDHDKPVKCRQIAIQGEGTMMYVIKATAPAAEWPKAGEVFDSAIATFKLAAATPATQSATQAATRAAETAASAPATQPAP